MCIAGLLTAFHAHATPFLPASDNQVLEKLPGRSGDTSTRELAALRTRAQQAPSDASAQAALAQRYIDLAAARGDPRYIGYADALLQRFPKPFSAELFTIRGVLRQYRHDFQGGLQDFAQALKLDPEYAEAHAWRGAIHLVQADYPAATKECTALKRLGREALHGACLGLVQAYGGELHSGYQTLLNTLNITRSDASRLWLLTRLGEIAAWQARPDLARQHYLQALALGQDDVYLLAAWSDFLLDTGQPREVVKLLSAWESADSLLVRLAIAEGLVGSPSAQKHRDMLRDRFAAARARGDTTHLAEEARFELQVRKDAATALRLAQENYAHQREPRDARVLLETAIAAKQRKAAQPALEWLQSSKFEDPRMRQLGKELQ